MATYSDEDMLSDGGTTATEESTPKGEENDHNEGDSATALVPTSFCPGMKPGDTFEVKVEEVQDGQYLLSYPGVDHGSEEEGPEKKPAASKRDTEMDDYMS